MNAKRRTAIAAAVLIAVVGTTGAGCSSSPKNSASKAQTSNNSLAGQEYSEFTGAVPYPFANCNGTTCSSNMPSDPLERKNLAKRLVQYNSKGDTNYVYVFTFSGQVIGYYVINGKVSSTGSQMTSTQINVSCGSNSAQCTNDAIGDDGSYGPEEGGGMGVFFFTSAGTLVETDQPFLVSSSPVPVFASAPQLDAPAKK
jgi:hypothetical protein